MDDVWQIVSLACVTESSSTVDWYLSSISSILMQQSKQNKFPKSCRMLDRHSRLMFLIHLSTRFSLVWWKSYNWIWACIHYNTMPMKRGFLNHCISIAGDKWNHAWYQKLLWWLAKLYYVRISRAWLPNSLQTSFELASYQS